MSSLKAKVLDKAASVIQNHDPVNQLDLHLISLPCYTQCMNKHRVTHHYCHHIEPGIWQCVMYDGPNKDSHLIGLEWVITEDKFQTIPEESVCCGILIIKRSEVAIRWHQGCLDQLRSMQCKIWQTHMDMRSILLRKAINYLAYQSWLWHFVHQRFSWRTWTRMHGEWKMNSLTFRLKRRRLNVQSAPLIRSECDRGLSLNVVYYISCNYTRILNDSTTSHTG